MSFANPGEPIWRPITTTSKEMDDINSLPDLFEAVDAAHKDFNRGQLWWRGQARYWPLQPSVHRVRDRGPYERGVALNFRGEARSRAGDCPPANDFASWMFLMQHHGLPTRLLDWTASPLVALHFAVCEEEQKESDGVLFVLDPWSLNKTTLEVEGTMEPSELGPMFDAAFSTNRIPASWQTAIALTTDEANSRAVAQQARFTIHGSDEPLDRYSGNESFLGHLTVPASSKERIRSQLARAGIAVHRLFPDLDHLAKWVKKKCFCGRRPCVKSEEGDCGDRYTNPLVDHSPQPARPISPVFRAVLGLEPDNLARVISEAPHEDVVRGLLIDALHIGMTRESIEGALLESLDPPKARRLLEQAIALA